jgi:membrane protein required for colicin V production
MSLFDLAAGLASIVSVLAGWVRGGAREIGGVASLALAAAIALLSIKYAGPIARHAIHTTWLANAAAVLVVFGVASLVLRALAGVLSRTMHDGGLGGLDRFVGAGFGLARALVVLGLANLALTAVTPPGRTPAWFAGAVLYPLSSASADTLKTFAPDGVKLAKRAGPEVARALGDDGDHRQLENRPNNEPPK